MMGRICGPWRSWPLAGVSCCYLHSHPYGSIIDFGARMVPGGMVGLLLVLPVVFLILLPGEQVLPLGRL